jgi:hypothetical protein
VARVKSAVAGEGLPSEEEAASAPSPPHHSSYNAIYFIVTVTVPLDVSDSHDARLRTNSDAQYGYHQFHSKM